MVKDWSTLYSCFEYCHLSVTEQWAPRSTRWCPVATSAGLVGKGERRAIRVELGSTAAIPGLTRALNDRDPEVRQAAAEALGKTQ